MNIPDVNFLEIPAVRCHYIAYWEPISQYALFQPLFLHCHLPSPTKCARAPSIRPVCVPYYFISHFWLSFVLFLNSFFLKMYSFILERRWGGWAEGDRWVGIWAERPTWGLISWPWGHDLSQNWNCCLPDCITQAPLSTLFFNAFPSSLKYSRSVYWILYQFHCSWNYKL